ncbi:leucine-rich repeat-containing protein 27 [Bombina bombina]|uniref:leucine-rich repeat-containing protein 27 n=1 Tax=Bombina bombina TaxID=8345 RepID=UPI00235A75B5|nr:leucine-rich repeat-containing protein 27 [Bombina bombina]
MDKQLSMQCSLRSEYRHTVVGNQTFDIKSPLKQTDLHSNEHSTTCDTLDLSKKNLTYLSEDLYKSDFCIKNIHLQGNALCCLPEDFFQQLPYLVWLDLRYNKITSLPSAIGEHRQLQYLLLEGNPLQALPIELGDLTTLKALNLRHCPLEFPPKNIVQNGLESILSFLKNARRENQVGSESSEADRLPVEKLQLNDLLDSSLEMSEEWENEEQRKQFEMLKKRIQQEDLKELNQWQTLGLQAVPQGTANLKKTEKCAFLTESRHVVTKDSRNHGANRNAEMKERLALIHQKNKDQEILKEWQKQTKIMQDKKARERPAKEVKILSIAPYAISLENDDLGKQNSAIDAKQENMPRITSGKSLKEMKRESSSRDLKLEQRIREHIQAMKERKKSTKGTAHEELETSKKELEEAALLQAELLRRKQEQEYRFTAFTGEFYSSPASQAEPENVFTSF